MVQPWIIYGSWKLRHNEPLKEEERKLVLFPVNSFSEERESIVIPLGREVRFEDALYLNEQGKAEERERVHPDEEWALRNIPLGILREGVLTHLTLRTEEEFVQMVKVPGGREEAALMSDKPLWSRIYELNEREHLVLSNHECYFIKANETTELEQKFHFEADLSYWRAHQYIFAAVDEGQFPGYTLKLSDEYQSWSFDNYLFELEPNDRHDQGYISAIHYCKKKSRWDDPLYMFKKKIYNEDALERWEKNYENQWIDRDIKSMLEAYFDYPTRGLPPWRRTRCDIGVESDAGNIFMINIDDCRIIEESSQVSAGRLQQCEIEYISTRGVPDEAKVYADFHRLTNLVEQFFVGKGWKPKRTYYSKMTFLNDYMALSAGKAPM